MPGLDFFNMYDAESIYKGEANALSDDRKSIEFGAGDWLRHIGASMLGRPDDFSKEGLLKGARKEFVDKYNSNPERLQQIERIRQTLGGTKVDTSGLSLPETGISTSAQNVKLSGQEALGTAVRAGQAQNPRYFDKSNIGPGATIGDVDSESARALEQGDNDMGNPNSRARVTADKEDADDWKKLMFQTQQQNTQDSKDHRQFITEQNILDRQENRQLQREQNQQTLQLAIMDRSDKKEERRIAREDRLAEKRQASIMMLMKGLTQLGYNFSI